jgi:alkaline phosphatase D
MRTLLACVLLLLAGPALGQSVDITRIAFGSCAHQDKEQPIWNAVLAEKPDMFVFLGDNIYGDTENMDEMRTKYDKLAAKPGFQALRQSTQVYATWDDHDFGKNDAGAEFPKKADSRAIFFDFWGVPADSPRRGHEGVYDSDIPGEPGRRVQIILLDLRWNRSAQTRVSDAEYEERKLIDMGPYAPSDDPNQTMLGEAQWVWLESELRKPAELRIIASSLPFGMDFTGWETWANYPLERQRLIDLIKKTGASGVVFLSGDTHWAELSRVDRGTPYPLWDFTSSGLTQEWKGVSPNANRVGGYTWHANYGLLTVNWDLPDPQIVVDIRNVDNEVVLRQALRLSDLAASGS